MKAFVTTTPVDGGSIIRMRTWVDGRVAKSYLLQFITYMMTGISASQLNADAVILSNKIRLKKPILQPFDGPYNRTGAWLKQFYSEGSANLTRCDGGYHNDW